ncbi:hypothetical protein [Streptomyces albipurpureus]|uniref:Uncharacterized protein n=1 Tax=Streptomyces albipurpureus TaxID=2897419 RepID=A0ABT0UUR3_9ACTN|nr:hypothetical protein [Streptomyces sp. CWNU-1]MCM2392205.1 hypothetical protein [Streptomyces sp. CWNU-1]
MRTRLIAFRAAGTVGAAGVAAALLLAPAAGSAYAYDPVTATVSPAGAGPGDHVEIQVRGCQGDTGTARSPSFSDPAELRGKSSHDSQRSQYGDDSSRSGEESSSDREDARSNDDGATSDSREGASDGGGGRSSGQGGSASNQSPLTSGHTLHGRATIKAWLSPGTYDVTVRCGGREHHAAGTIHITGDHGRPVHPSPVAPVRAGGGGTAALAAEQRPHNDTDGAGPGTPHTVVGLVLAGAAAVAVAVRSSRRRRQGSD